MDGWEKSPRRLAAKRRARKLVTAARNRHNILMRRLIPFLSLPLAACGSQTPPPKPIPAAVSTNLPPRQIQRNDLIGLSANELVSQFGTPRLQIRDGDGTKLQFASSTCLLDTYLYPGQSGGGLPRVTYVDAYRRDGRTMSPQECSLTLLGR